MSDIVIVAGARTPMGGFQGSLAGVSAVDLGAVAIREAVQRAGIAAEDVQEVIMGCVLPAGLKQGPARQAALAAGLPAATGCTTINKLCGSGMKAVMLAHDLLKAGTNQVMVAGGMESMSNAPYLLERARSGYRMGHGKVLDHMFLDGLEDAYDKGRLMGTFAEDCAEAYGFTREAQDEFAVASLTRAQQAMRDGRFQAEIVPLTVTAGKTERLVDSDEQPPKARLDKIPTLKPAFREGGTVTAANSSSISDGAAALVLASAEAVEKHGLTPRARVLGMASAGVAPRIMGIGPVPAVRKLLRRLDLAIDAFDVIELNEAFASQGLACLRELGVADDSEKVNPNGGAIALGHPLGMSGARLVLTALHQLEKSGGRRGLATMCVGVGQGLALAIERV